MSTKKLQIVGRVVTTDETLTQSGAAADAKATGDAIASLDTLVGDTAVATQISEAVSAITPDSIGALDVNNYYGIVRKEGPLVYAKSLNGLEIGAVSNITASQSGTGDPSSENVCPISGWDTVTLSRLGQNLVSHHDYVKTQGHKSTVITDDCINVTNPTTYDYGNIPVSLIGGVPYTLYIEWEVYGRDESDTSITRAGCRLTAQSTTTSQITMNSNGVQRAILRYTPDADVDTTIVFHPNYGNDGAGGRSSPVCSRTRIMLVVGSYTLATVPSFEPCKSQTLTATLPETVYGGTLDWMTGELTVTHGQIAAYAGEDVPDGWTSSMGELIDGAQIVYPLDEPYAVQLVPQQLVAVDGINYVWSDCGNTCATFNYTPLRDTVVDAELSSTSTNPVQNKVVNAAIADLNELVGDTAVATQINNAISNITREDLLIFVSATEPASPVTGMLWFDIS